MEEGVMSFDLASQMDFEMSRNSFAYFFQTVLGYEFADFHQEWYDKIQEGDRTVIVCSRDHGKSVFMHSWVVWNLVFQEPPYQMLYISSNHKQTMVHMREIDKYFNHPILAKFRPSKGWAIGHIRLTNGNEILERSVGSQIRGLHPNEIIIDDPLKEFSLSAIKKVSDWFFGDMIPTLHHSAKLRMIGTPFTYTDIFSTLQEHSAYDVTVYPCLNQLNEPLWPSRWGYEELMRRKDEVGSLKFTREYLCIPISSGTMLFNPEYINDCKAKGKNSYLGHRAKEGMKYYVGIDPAISTDGDYNVIVVLEVDENKNKQVIYMDRQKNVDFRENIHKAKTIGKLFNPAMVMFETNTFAKSFTQELRHETDLNVRDFTTTRNSKQEIILNLQMNIENGKIIFPRGNEESRRVTDLIIEELAMFGITDGGRFEGMGAHDDTVMALALANHATHRGGEGVVLLDDLSSLFDEQPFIPQYNGGGIYALN